MAVVWSVVGFILMIGVLVTLHELGHFLIARWRGFLVPLFSIGFGPKLWEFKGKHTTYRISLIPLGGYVRVLGLAFDEQALMEKESAITIPRGTRWERAAVYLAGPLMNILLAFFLSTVVFLIGIEAYAVKQTTPVVGYVYPQSPAEKAGVQRGDKILSIDSVPTPTWQKLIENIYLAGGKSVSLKIEREGKILTLPVTIEKQGPYRIGYLGVEPVQKVQIREVFGKPARQAGLKPGDLVLRINDTEITSPSQLAQEIQSRPDETITLTIKRGKEELTIPVTLGNRKGKGFLGIGFQPAERDLIILRYPLGKAIQESIQKNLSETTLLFRFLQQFLEGRGSVWQLSGPIDMARYSGMVLQKGIFTFLMTLASISLQLGLLNLFPIPLLDGGHLLILAVEGIIRRDLPMKWKETIAWIGFLFLISFMVMVLSIDILRNFFL